MPVDSGMRAKAIADLKTMINSGKSYIGDGQILSLMAHRIYHDYVPGFEDGWKRFKDEKGGETNFAEMTEQFRAAMRGIATAKAGFSQDFAKELVEAITSE